MPENPILGMNFRAGPLRLEQYPAVGSGGRLIGHAIFSNSGNISVFNGEVGLHLKYGSIDPGSEVRGLFHKEKLPTFNYRSVSHLVLNSRDGHKFDLASALPGGWSSYFNVAPVGTERPSFANDTHRSTVLTDQRVFSPSGILAYLHEAGHARTTNFIDYSNSETTLDDPNSEYDPADAKVLLGAENMAWAFALEALKPFMSVDPTATFYVGDLAKFAYGQCLASYGREIFDKMNMHESNGLSLVGGSTVSVSGELPATN